MYQITQQELSHNRTIEIQGDLDKDTLWQGPEVRLGKNTGLEMYETANTQCIITWSTAHN